MQKTRLINFPPLQAIVFLIGIALVAACEPQQRGVLQFNEAVLRVPVPGMDKSVGYVEIENTGHQVITLKAVHSEMAGAIELHETQETDGMMRMRRLPSLSIPAQSEVDLQPNGKHLMFFRLQGILVGEQVEVTFVDTDDVSHTTLFEVVPLDYRR